MSKCNSLFQEEQEKSAHKRYLQALSKSMDSGAGIMSFEQFCDDEDQLPTRES